MPNQSISKSVIKRLPVYLRILDQMIQRKIDMVSSKELSSESGFTAEQIRKDLAYFGAFGTRGAGYNTVFLREKTVQAFLQRPTARRARALRTSRCS
jgi:redox-sensing transcriptional repressor